MPRPRYKSGEEVEFIPNALEEFDRALRAVAKVKPKPRPVTKVKAATRVAKRRGAERA